MTSTVKPIPLTEEWLVKFGFKEEYTFEFYLRFGSIEVMVENEYTDTGEWNISIYGRGLPPDVMYVHQLQNIVFAMIGEELKIQYESN